MDKLHKQLLLFYEEEYKIDQAKKDIKNKIDQIKQEIYCKCNHIWKIDHTNCGEHTEYFCSNSNLYKNDNN